MLLRIKQHASCWLAHFLFFFLLLSIVESVPSSVYGMRATAITTATWFPKLVIVTVTVTVAVPVAVAVASRSQMSKSVATHNTDLDMDPGWCGHLVQTFSVDVDVDDGADGSNEGTKMCKMQQKTMQIR